VSRRSSVQGGRPCWRANAWRPARISVRVHRCRTVGRPAASWAALQLAKRREEQDAADDAVPVGNPWEVRLPTSLVHLQPDATLPGATP
jgi:hypothetical protein